jgi:hypothetical protein
VALLILLLSALLLLSAPSAETRLFEGAGWEVWCAADSGAAPRSMAVSVRGGSPRRCSELKVRRRMEGFGRPQVFSIKGIGALRPALPPPGAFGATFYASGYWDCRLGLRQTLAIETLDLSLEPAQPGTLRFAGRAANLPTLAAPDFVLELEPPSASGVSAALSYTLVAAEDVCVRPEKQALKEGFRIARAASNYISGAVHDSDGVEYVDREGRPVCAPLVNREDFALPAPAPLGSAPLTLLHRRPVPRATPSAAIRFIEPPPGEVTPQGYVTGTLDPDADNIDLWGNWDAARSSYRAGERIGRFRYRIEARAPAAPPCGQAG